MRTNLFNGKLVRLTAEEPQALAQAFTRWERDSEYHRLLDNDPASLRSEKQYRQWIEKDQENQHEILFGIRPLAEDRLIGFIGLFATNWTAGDTLVGIGIGERQVWGQGYGTDAMQVILRYAFTELNLHRVSLLVFGYNPRAIRSYEKAGFQLEGRLRQVLRREGQYWDVHFMGILQAEWRAAQSRNLEQLAA